MFWNIQTRSGLLSSHSISFISQSLKDTLPVPFCGGAAAAAGGARYPDILGDW